MSTNPHPHVLIVGAGLAGLTLAQILRKNGVSFEVFERDESADARAQGWAIALHGPLLKDLQASLPEDIGPIEQTNHLMPLDHLPAQFVFYHSAQPGMRVGVEDDETGQILRANRLRLRNWLRTHIPVQYGKRLMRVEEDGEKVMAHFEDGTLAIGDILIGAEGTRSTVRKHILHGKDVMKPLPIGSLVGEIELTGADFIHQLELGHSAYIVLPDSNDKDQCSIFAALNKVSPDGKTGYYYFILHWIDREAANSTADKPYWTVMATRKQLAEFAHEKAKNYPPHLRVLLDKVPVERYVRPGIVLQAVELTAQDLPAGRLMLIGDAAHSMTPFRGEAGVSALQDGLNLGRAITRIKDSQGSDFKEIMTEYRDDMIARGTRAIRVSNPVLEQAAENPNREWITCSKVATHMPKKTVVL